ncbi:MAG: hypothetical protein JW768_12810, partial [Chitinispirillaceae bacterium]|nr:hypothetical protein [Chitinispirillaceae bacterium]
MNAIQLTTCAVLLSLFSVLAAADTAPYTDLIPKYNRIQSPVMIRVIDKPTLARLDYAAYTANPIRFDPEKQKPKKPANPMGIQDMNFNGALKKAVVRVEETPLTKEEIAMPLAWAPLMNQLWVRLKADGLQRLGSKIISKKWGDPDVFKPYQDIAALYLHKKGETTEFWVRIEFMPWVKFLKGFSDADKDGFKEVYGLLNTGTVDKAQIDSTVAYITGEYRTQRLSREEVVDWANVLASYWYPTLNTDIVDMGGASEWPTLETDRAAKRFMKKRTIKNPTAVIRGNPHGKVLYNVFIVKGMDKASKKKEEKPVARASAVNAIDTTVSENFKANNARFARELKPFGDYAAWAKKLAPIHDSFTKVLAAVPKDQMGIQGRDGWLFFRKSIDYLVAPDLASQPQDKNPLPHLIEFNAYLKKHGVNFLFVAVPCKEEFYYEKLGISRLRDTNAIIAPYGRKLLADLQKNGIEVIDLMPLFLKARADDPISREPVYQRQDTHWTYRGLQAAAQAIADRIRSYSWYQATEPKMEYTFFDTTCVRQGDIVERIPEAERT